MTALDHFKHAAARCLGERLSKNSRGWLDCRLVYQLRPQTSRRYVLLLSPEGICLLMIRASSHPTRHNVSLDESICGKSLESPLRFGVPQKHNFTACHHMLSSS